MKKYKVIYIDSPWTYKDKARAGERGVEYKYKTMKINDIYNLPIYDLADKDCFLFSWTTWPLLENGIEAIKRWGFKYKTIGFNWIKTNSKNHETLFWGGGSYSRANSEICLMGVKGKPKRVAANIHSVVVSPHPGKKKEDHSRKPNEVRDRIVRLAGDVPRIEIFAREVFDGWDCFGDHEDVISSPNFVDIFGGNLL